MAFDITALNAALGAYARENSRQIFMDAIYSPVENPETTVWDILQKVVIMDEQAYGLADFDLEVMEAADSFTSQGDVVTIDGGIFKLRKMDSSFNLPVYSLYKTWMQHIYTEAFQNNLDTGDIKAGMLSFSSWLFDNIIKKFMEKFMLLSSFQGEYTPGFDYVASFGSAVDGFNKIVIDARTAGDIPAAQVVATGAITSANAYDSLEDMGKAIPTKLLYKDHFLFSNIATSDNYNIDYRATHGGNNPLIYDKYKRRRLDDRERVSILPTPEMGDAGLVFTSPPNNMFWFSDFDRNEPQILTAVAEPKIIKVTMSYAAAFGFKRKDHIVCNDWAPLP